MKKNSVPCEVNNLFLIDIPNQISRLNVLYVRDYHFFKKSSCNAKRAISKTERGTVNISVDVSDMIKKLPFTHGLILMKLMKKLSFKGHIYFKPVLRSMSSCI